MTEEIKLENLNLQDAYDTEVRDRLTEFGGFHQKITVETELARQNLLTAVESLSTDLTKTFNSYQVKLSLMRAGNPSTKIYQKRSARLQGALEALDTVHEWLQIASTIDERMYLAVVYAHQTLRGGLKNEH